MDIVLIKQAGAFVPASEVEIQKVSKIKNGDLCIADIKKPRNNIYLKRFFAMLNLAFEAFEPPEKYYKGFPVEKNFDSFREYVIIAAGFYSVTFDLDGKMRLKADSISFANMDEIKFRMVFSAVANVLLQKVLHNYTRDDLDEIVEKLIRF